jgi:hypothetical protein
MFDQFTERSPRHLFARLEASKRDALINTEHLFRTPAGKYVSRRVSSWHDAATRLELFGPPRAKPCHKQDMPLTVWPVLQDRLTTVFTETDLSRQVTCCWQFCEESLLPVRF